MEPALPNTACPAVSIHAPQPPSAFGLGEKLAWQEVTSQLCFAIKGGGPLTLQSLLAQVETPGGSVKNLSWSLLVCAGGPAAGYAHSAKNPTCLMKFQTGVSITATRVKLPNMQGAFDWHFRDLQSSPASATDQLGDPGHATSPLCACFPICNTIKCFEIYGGKGQDAKLPCQS